jgi:uncharacterized integral membrane protein
VWPAVVAGLVLAAAIVIFVAQNTHAISLDFLWLHFRTSPAVLVLVTALVAVALSIAVGAWLRARRRRVLHEREELERLRREPPISAARAGTSSAPVDDQEHARPQ